ncbi:DsrE family protein [bacterium]|nr:DsrE family protein [bacterium]MBU1990668.1 DsrE family protein [bacterium]
MKKIFLLLVYVLILQAEDTLRAVYDLTASKTETFEQKILKAIVSNKAYYEGQFKELEVAVVIHGGAYKFFVKELSNTEYKDEKELIKASLELKKRIESISKNYNVEFLMCEIGAKKHKLKREDVYSFVKMVPNATIGLIDKQNEGYAYIPVRD